MTRRQIIFHNRKNNTYYVSEAYNGDKREMEFWGMQDTCEKTWQEILDDLNEVHSLSEFLQAIARITGYYHSSISDALPGTRLHICHSEDELISKDETYIIYSDKAGVYLDLEHSLCIKEGDVFPNDVQ